MTNVLFTDDLVQLKHCICFRPTQFCIIKYTLLLIFFKPEIGMEMSKTFANVIVHTHFKGKHATN